MPDGMSARRDGPVNRASVEIDFNQLDTPVHEAGAQDSSLGAAGKDATNGALGSLFIWVEYCFGAPTHLKSHACLGRRQSWRHSGRGAWQPILPSSPTSSPHVLGTPAHPWPQPERRLLGTVSQDREARRPQEPWTQPPSQAPLGAHAQLPGGRFLPLRPSLLETPTAPRAACAVAADRPGSDLLAG